MNIPAKFISSFQKHSFLLLGILSIPILLWTSRWGSGLEDDAAYYIAGARSLAHGMGFSTLTPTGYRSSITWFPPFYSFVLSLGRFLGVDSWVGAKYLQTLLFFMNSILIGKIIEKITGSLLAPVIGVFLFIFSRDILFVHTMAWSEPLFIFFLLLSFMSFSNLFEEDDFKPLLISAGLIGLATLTRYAGVSLLLTGVIAATLNRRQSLSRRVFRGLILGGVGALPLALLFVRNKILGGAPTNRTLAFHFQITDEQRNAIGEGLSSWFNNASPGYLPLISVIILLVFAILMSLKIRTTLHPLFKIAAVFIAVYVPFLAAVTVLFDADMILSAVRIFSPLHVACIIVLVSISSLSVRISRRIIWASIPLLAVLGLFFLNGFSYIKELGADGIEFAAKRWRRSPTLGTIKKDFPHIGIYSNVPSAIYLWTDSPCDTVPVRYDKLARQPFPDFDLELQGMCDAIKEGKALLVILYNDNDDLEMPSLAEIGKLISLKCLAQTEDGAIYGPA